VTVDTLRADRLGFAGHAAARTPVLDDLAARGVRFDTAIAAAPITLPSHATILTGLEPPHHGVRNNGIFSLPEDRTTLAERLAAAGYDTAAVVGAFVLDSRYGLGQGFGSYDDEMVPLEGEGAPALIAQRPADRVTDAALAWLDRRVGTGPVFLWVHYFDPHIPYEPPPPFGGSTLEERYDGEIAFVDLQLGRLLRGFEARGLLGRTLLVFTADHGEGLGEHGEQTHSFLLYDATMRVPLVFVPPGARRGARVSDRAAGSVDILPTVLDLLALPVPPGLDGESLVRPPREPDRPLYLETFGPLYACGWSPLHALRRLEDKFVEAPSPEYYALRSDPGETRNLFRENPVAARALRARLERRFREDPQVAMPGSAASPDPEERARLAALGYFSEAAASAPGGARRPDPKDMMPVFYDVLRARGLLDAKKFEEAEALLRDVLQRSPDDLLALAQVARLDRALRRFDEAEATLRRQIALLPTAEAWVSLAEVHLEKRDLDAFLEDVHQARALEPRYGGIQIALGDRLALEGQFEDAIHAFEGAIALDPSRFGADARRKIALARERLAAASRPAGR
jgi:arylsulfatase A-like enzyme